jgi:hypothetical protein
MLGGSRNLACISVELMSDNPDEHDSLETRVRLLEKGEQAAADNIKASSGSQRWVFGIFMAVVLALISGNAWFSHSTFQNEKESIEARLAAFQAKATFENEKQFDAFKKQSESAFLSYSNSFTFLSNNFQSELLSVKAQNDRMNAQVLFNISNAFAFHASNIVLVYKELGTDVFHEVDRVMGRNITNLQAQVNRALKEQGENANRATARAKGMAFMVAGSQFMFGKSQDRPDQLAHCASDLLQAADELLEAQDELNLSRALHDFSQICVIEFANNTPKGRFLHLVTQYQLVERITSILPALEKTNVNGNHQDCIDLLKYEMTVLQGKLPLGREKL